MTAAARRERHRKSGKYDVETVNEITYRLTIINTAQCS